MQAIAEGIDKHADPNVEEGDALAGIAAVPNAEVGTYSWSPKCLLTKAWT